MKYDLQALDAALAKRIEEKKLPGVSVAIRGPEGIIFEKGYGFCDEARTKPVNEWDIGSAVNEHRLMRIRYHKLKEPDKVMRLIQPVGIMFSEYYFYLCAYMSASEETPDVPKRPFRT